MNQKASVKFTVKCTAPTEWKVKKRERKKENVSDIPENSSNK